jgi:hypothetical protein
LNDVQGDIALAGAAAINGPRPLQFPPFALRRKNRIALAPAFSQNTPHVGQGLFGSDHGH